MSLVQVFSGLVARLLPPPLVESPEDVKNRLEARENVQQAKIDITRWEQAMAEALRGGKGRAV